jgi:hypothetical protein
VLQRFASRGQGVLERPRAQQNRAQNQQSLQSHLK